MDRVIESSSWKEPQEVNAVHRLASGLDSIISAQTNGPEIHRDVKKMILICFVWIVSGQISQLFYRSEVGGERRCLTQYIQQESSPLPWLIVIEC